MLLFKQIAKAIRETSEALNTLIHEDELDVYKMELLERQSALKEVLEYIKTYQWLSHENSKDRVRRLLASGYDYNQVAQDLGVAKGTLHTTMWYANNKLKEKIGATTIELIMTDSVDLALTQFRVGTGVMDFKVLFADEVLEKVPEGTKGDYFNLTDCLTELNVLKIYTYKTIDSVFGELDNSKLSFIRHILESTDSTYAEHRQIILGFLLGGIENEESLHLMLSSLDIFKTEDSPF